MHSTHTRRMTPTGLSSLAGRARAFTLVEMVVAIGAVGLVAVGLAAIFNSVGKTVSGGRRVSQLNTYSSLIESQMRRDFQNMSRDGFLVIRQQWHERIHLDGGSRWLRELFFSLFHAPMIQPDTVKVQVNDEEPVCQELALHDGEDDYPTR